MKDKTKLLDTNFGIIKAQGEGNEPPPIGKEKP